MGDNGKELTATQQSILYKKRDNPDWDNTEIADAVGCSDSHVSETLDRWDPSDMRDDGTVPKDSGSWPLWIYLPIILPLKIAMWTVEWSVKITLWVTKWSIWLMLLPFTILFGSPDDD